MTQNEEVLKELRLHVQDNKAVIGTETVLKELKAGRLAKVFLARNCTSQMKSDLRHYAKLVEVPVIELEYSNEELGIFCKKNFFVAVVGIRGE